MKIFFFKINKKNMCFLVYSNDTLHMLFSKAGLKKLVQPDL